MSYGEAMKAVFPFLNGTDLAACLAVCKDWQEIARDDYLWKCLCAKRWPSTCKRSCQPFGNYYKLYQTFSRRQLQRTRPPPRLSFDDMDFYIDIWTEEEFIFSEVVPGSSLHRGSWSPPSEVSDVLRFHLEGPEYKMVIPVEPRIFVPLGLTIHVSVLVERKDTRRVACLINESIFDYVDRTSYRAHAFDYLVFSPVHPFVSDIRAWISLLFMNGYNEGVIDVFGIELDFCDAANDEREVLWLLDILDWK